MKLFVYLSFIFVFSGAASGLAASDPAFSTLASAVIHGDPENYEVLHIPIMNRRLPGYGRHRKLKVGFAPALNLQGSAPSLVVIVSGLGSGAKSNLSTFLAQKVQEAGAAALVMPNSFTVNFAVAASTTGLVGAARADAWDLMMALETTLTRLRERGHVFQSVSVLGYSHGGLLAAFLHSLNFHISGLPVTSYFLINPPVDLLYSMRVLDEKAKSMQHIPLSRLLGVGLHLRNEIKRMGKIPFEDDMPDRLINDLTSRKWHLSRDEAYALISTAMMAPLKNVILASQAVRDQGILPPPGLEGSVVRRYEDAARAHAAGRFQFETYVKTFFPAMVRSGTFSIEELNRANSLGALTADLSTATNLFILHNQDDFLVRPQDLRWLKDTVRDRLRLFPHGGHMGNLAEPEMLRAIATSIP